VKEEKMVKRLMKKAIAIALIAVTVMTVLIGAMVGTETDASSDSYCIVPEGFKTDIFAVRLGDVEDFTFDSSGNLFVGGGHTGEIREIDFDEDTPLPIDGSTLDPVIVGLHAVFGLAFDESGDMFVSEFDNGEITKIEFPLPEPLPFNASTVPPMAYLTCPDGMAFAPPGSPFGTELFVGDVGAGGIFKVYSNGTVTPFVILGCDIEEVIFSNSGDLLFAIGAGCGKIFSVLPDGTTIVIASGFAFPDAIAQGPGNAFGEYLYVGDLHGNTLFRIDPVTGDKSVFAVFDSDFGGFEDIVFDSEGNMFILGFGRGGQIIKISPATTVSISTDKVAYSPGDTMNVTICLINPFDTPQNLRFRWWLTVPKYHHMWMVADLPVTLPVSYDECFTFSIDVGDWGDSGFGAIWGVGLFDPSMDEIIDYDTTSWNYVPSPTVQEKMTPADIAEQIKKTIEGIELPLPG